MAALQKRLTIAKSVVGGVTVVIYGDVRHTGPTSRTGVRASFAACRAVDTLILVNSSVLH